MQRASNVKKPTKKSPVELEDSDEDGNSNIDKCSTEEASQQELLKGKSKSRSKTPELKRIRTRRMTLLPPNPQSKIRLIPTARVSPAKWVRASSSPPAGASSASDAAAAGSSHCPPTPRARPPIRTIPRTRVLKTPDRLTPPGVPINRQLRTPDKKLPRLHTGKIQRKWSIKCKTPKTRRQKPPKSESSLSSSSSARDSAGVDSSDDESSAEEPPARNPKQAC